MEIDYSDITRKIMKDKALVLEKRIVALENELFNLYSRKFDIENKEENLKYKYDNRIKNIMILKMILIAIILGFIYYSGVNLFLADFNKLLLLGGYISLIFGIGIPITLNDKKKIKRMSYDYKERLLNDKEYIEIEKMIEKKIEELDIVRFNHNKLIVDSCIIMNKNNLMDDKVEEKSMIKIKRKDK